jgi:DNA polymerase III alpha subunit
MEEFVEKMHICASYTEGANRRYPEITEVIRERWILNLTISNSGYPGYFLIVQDLIKKVWVFR